MEPGASRLAQNQQSLMERRAVTKPILFSVTFASEAMRYISRRTRL